MTYKDFLRKKQFKQHVSGFDIDKDCLHQQLFEFQRDIVRWAIKKGKAAVFAGTGLGKCHGKGTEIIMYDGSIKKVEDIKTNDLLMGTDSKPRRVKSLARGTDKMYKIIPVKGESFICNEPHVLSLQMSGSYGNYKKDEIVNMPLNEYMNMPGSFKHRAKLWRASVEFNEKETCQDPYVMGIWLGDGTKKSPDITTGNKDIEVIKYLEQWSEKEGLVLTEKGISGNSITRSFTVKNANQWNKNHFRNSIAKFVLNGEKRIPEEYLINSRERRLSLLAGLIDSDGYHVDNCYEIVTKYKGLSDDILYLARSLGFGTTHRVVKKGIKESGFKAEYQKIIIYGHTDNIPCKVKRKQAKPRKQKKNVLRTGFKVEYIGIDNYYGFEITGDHLYLLKDFTVTHNTLMQLEWARQINENTGKNVLILAPLAVASQTVREAEKINLSVTHIRQDIEVTDGVNITNYEQLHNVDTSKFDAVVLDESSILKSFTSKTRDLIINTFKDYAFKLACTATPAPNDHMELGNHSEFLNIMKRTEMLSMFFVHDAGQTQKWRLKGHAEDKFWEWVSSWAVLITKPSELGYEDGNFDLPSLNMNELVVEGKANENELFPTFAQTLSERRQARKDSLEERVQKAADLVNATEEQFLVWCDLNRESELLTKAINDSVEVKGSDKSEHKEKSLLGFADGSVNRLVSKPSIAGMGMNWQGCRNMVFVGLSDSFEQVFQAIRRCWRFGQEREVNVYIVISEQEGAVLENIKRKEKDFDIMQEGMIRFTKDIVSENIKSTTTEKTEYIPTEKMEIPNFLKGSVKI